MSAREDAWRRLRLSADKPKRKTREGGWVEARVEMSQSKARQREAGVRKAQLSAKSISVLGDHGMKYAVTLRVLPILTSEEGICLVDSWKKPENSNCRPELRGFRLPQ